MTPPALVVVAHPRADSYCAELARRTVAGLEASGRPVRTLDLYALGFRAAMGADEHVAYLGDGPLLDPMAAEHARLLAATDTLAFVYPTWWGGLPAILKGWLDRVAVPGVAFTLHERGAHVRPGLRQLRTVIGVSTYGSPRWYVRLMSDGGRRTMVRTMRLASGPHTSTHWLGMYGLDRSTDDERTAFAERVERRLRTLG